LWFANATPRIRVIEVNSNHARKSAPDGAFVTTELILQQQVASR